MLTKKEWFNSTKVSLKDKNMKRYEFIEKVLYLIRQKLEHNLPDEATLDEMIEKYKKLTEEIL